MKQILDIDKLLMEMTLEEKASLCSGADFWHTKAVERLGIPAVMVSDGPHGLRKQEEEADHLGVAESIKAVCFPTASAMACSFNRELLQEVGAALGEECQAEDVAVLLGPGVNMKRSPLCGRNFEYYSEDPYLAGELGAAFVQGVQSQEVGVSLKHFAANNQEWRRFSISAQVEERPLREIYLAPFERIVKKARPWTLMCSYNRINGTYSCENEWLLNQVLRREWGFQGLVMTDWGAMNERVPALKAGLELEMPSTFGENDRLLVEAVQDGSLSMETLDRGVRRILELVDRSLSHRRENASYDKEEHHALAKRMALDSAVLLKNDGILPLKREGNTAVIGLFAQNPRIQGGGSSHINCCRIDSALDALKDCPGITYAQGYRTDQDVIDEELEREAIQAASKADVAVIFAGLPDAFESEGYDRTHLDMPECQNHLIQAICQVQPKVAVVLHNGSPIRMPWLDKVSAVLEMYLAGQASGSAAVELLWGQANPSGKLAESFPLRLEDNPSYLNFPGTRTQVNYQEGIFIGYRYYDKKKMDVLFPFGFGLSYTSFQYGNMRLLVNGQEKASSAGLAVKDSDSMKLLADVTNVGKLAGSETVQLYVKNGDCEEVRPEKELKGFSKVFLQPGETKTVSFPLDQRSFAYYSTRLPGWYAPSGEYQLLLGASSRDIRCCLPLTLENSASLPFVIDATTTCEDIARFARDAAPLEAMLEKCGFAQEEDTAGDDRMGAGTAQLMKAMFADTPLHSIMSFSNGSLTHQDVQDTLTELRKRNL